MAKYITAKQAYSNAPLEVSAPKYSHYVVTIFGKVIGCTSLRDAKSIGTRKEILTAKQAIARGIAS